MAFFSMANKVVFFFIALMVLHFSSAEPKSLCPESPKAVFYWMPYGEEIKFNNNSMSGDLYDFVTAALGVCCSTLELTYSNMKVNASREIELSIREDNQQSLSLYFPVFANKYQKEKFQRPFIGLYDSPGPIVFQVDQPSKKGTVFAALTQSWQIPALCVLLAAISGVILWFLDHQRNRSELPQEFHKGAAVGLWWAFVTMTTVGYGDIAPKSFPGRMFAVIWMIIGCISLTLFNAQLTALITSSEIPTEFNLIGQTIVIPRGGKPFLEEEMNLGATIEEEDFEVIFQKISEKSDEVMMMYNYENIKMAQDFSKAIATSDRPPSSIKILKTIDHRFTIGITASGNISNTENFLRCMERKVVDSIIIKKQFVFREFTRHVPKPTEKSKEDNSLPYNLETMATLLALSVLVILVSFGFILEFCRRMKRDSSPGTTAPNYSDQLQLQNNLETSQREPTELHPERRWFRKDQWQNKDV